MPPVGGHYLAARLDALSGLIFWALEAGIVFTWVARLQLPFFHFASGAGQAVQSMNLMLGLPEGEGVDAPALWP